MNNRSDWMRGLLAIGLIIMFALAIIGLFRLQIFESNRETITYMLGQLSGMVTTAIAFYFSTTQSSTTKDHIIADMASNPTPKQVEVINTPSDPVQVELPVGGAKDK